MRVWSWPGNTADSALIRQAKANLKEWTLARIVWVGDRGFTSTEATAALARQGRYQVVADHLQVTEVRIREDERFIICLNPD